MAIELLDPKRNWAKISSNDGGPFFRTIAALPSLRATSGLEASVSANLTYPGTKASTGNAFTGKSFNKRK